MRHHGRVKEVSWVPIFEVRNSLKLHPSSIGVLAFISHAKRKGKCLDSMKYITADVEQAATIPQLMNEGWLVEHLISVLHDRAINVRRNLIFSDDLLEFTDSLRRQDQSRML